MFKLLLYGVILFIIFMRFTVPVINEDKKERLRRKNTTPNPHSKGSKYAEDAGEFVDYEEIK